LAPSQKLIPDWFDRRYKSNANVLVFVHLPTILQPTQLVVTKSGDSQKQSAAGGAPIAI